eukprot:m.22698 g.22698  ORF g.22698 m.22698 type:complete len:99 (-) comp3788_c0_seq1:104-400(-)
MAAAVKNEPGVKAEPGEMVTVNVQTGDSSVPVTFKLRKTQVLSKLMDAFCKQKGAAVGSYRFMLEGKLVAPTSTVEGAGIEDGDMLEAFANQTGGARC